MNPINGLSLPNVFPDATASPQQTAGPSGASFKNFLLESIREVNSMQQEADLAVEQLAGGGDVDPAEVLTAVQKADLAFRLMIQVRNKIVQAFDEVRNIRV